jgi:hypothetical protein
MLSSLVFIGDLDGTAAVTLAQVFAAQLGCLRKAACRSAKTLTVSQS